MHVTLVHIRVKPAFVDAFMAATQVNVKASCHEVGCIYFDLLQEIDKPTQFILYEVFKDEQAAAAHKSTPHYVTWRHDVAPMMAAPREGVRYHNMSEVL
jgi:(4S)-4-hydroxy-5-phosphonooxypentane-2,3-dione isomerase